MYDASSNVAAHLRALASASPDRAAVVWPSHGTQFTFRQLDADSDALAHGLIEIGITRGMRTALMVSPSVEFFSLTFALFKIGAVPVLIDPGMGIRPLGRCLGDAQPEAFIGIPKAHWARKLLGWAKSSIRITVTTGRRFLQARFTLRELRQFGAKAGSFPIAFPQPSEMAAILFTSGSTGAAKGAIYTHGMFATQVELLRQIYEIEPGEIDLSTFPLFALFGPALGMTAIIPDMDPTRPGAVDPKKIVDAVEKWGVTNLFGSPALLNRVGRYGAELGKKLPTLRRVISAGAPVSAAILERFATMLRDDVEIFTPYGATEALPVASVGSKIILQETRRQTEHGAGVCVGRPVPGIDVRVIRIRDDAIVEWHEALALPAGTIGEVTVRGPVVSQGYFHRPEAQALTKIDDPRTRTMWHRMGDLGYFDSLGRLWFCGRKSQRVQLANGTLFTIPCEALFNAHADVFRSALVGVSAAGAIHPVMCIELERTGSRRFAEIEPELQRIAAAHPHTRSIRTFLQHPAFPVDIRHNAKIFREKLAAWAQRTLGRRHWQPPADSRPIELPPIAGSVDAETARAAP